MQRIFALAAQNGERLTKRLTVTPTRNDLSHFSGLAQSHKGVTFWFFGFEFTSFLRDMSAAGVSCPTCPYDRFA